VDTSAQKDGSVLFHVSELARSGMQWDADLRDDHGGLGMLNRPESHAQQRMMSPARVSANEKHADEKHLQHDPVPHSA